MGYDSDRKAQAEQKAMLEDADWLAEKMVTLIAELKATKEPRRAAFVRGCLNAAMKQHGRLLLVPSPPAEDYDDDGR